MYYSLDFLATSLLGQELSLKKDLEVLANKRARNAEQQMTVMTERGSFPLGGFIEADGERAKLIAGAWQRNYYNSGITR